MALVHEHDWKKRAIFDEAGGYYRLETADTNGVEVRLFVTPKLLTEAEPTLYRQVVNATRFPGAKLVAITPDVHYGYGVPVGCVILTDRESGAVAMGPVGFDIGCGMMSARSNVPAELATPDRKLAFNREVTKRVSLGAGGKSVKLGKLTEKEFQELIRGGAAYYVDKYGASFDRSRAERHRIPVADDWDVPWGGKGSPERGLEQLGSLGGGNHFIELQKCEETGTLFVQVHTGSRGFGHGLATNYFLMAKDENPAITDLDLGYFTPASRHFREYLAAVAAGGNYAILNRLVIYEQIAEAFRKVFKEDLELVYEISHNLVQAEDHPEVGPAWVHRSRAGTEGASDEDRAGAEAIRDDDARRHEEELRSALRHRLRGPPHLQGGVPVKRAIVLAAVLLAPGVAHADATEKTACADAANRGQMLRDEGRLKDARALLTRCAQPTCPSVVRTSCTEWLSDLDQHAPTIVLRAMADGQPITDVRVTSDEEPLASSLGDKPVAIDPGSHTLRFTYAGQEKAERVVVKEREKNRVILVRFTSPAPEPPPVKEGPAAQPLPAKDPPAADVESRPVPTGVWVLGGVSLLALGSFAYFGYSARHELDVLRDTCAPTCAESDKDAAHQRAVVADVSLGVGAAALVGAAIWYFARPTVKTTGLVVTPSVGPTHAALGLGATF